MGARAGRKGGKGGRSLPEGWRTGFVPPGRDSWLEMCCARPRRRCTDHASRAVGREELLQRIVKFQRDQWAQSIPEAHLAHVALQSSSTRGRKYALGFGFLEQSTEGTGFTCPPSVDWARHGTTVRKPWRHCRADVHKSGSPKFHGRCSVFKQSVRCSWIPGVCVKPRQDVPVAWKVLQRDAPSVPS